MREGGKRAAAAAAAGWQPHPVAYISREGRQAGRQARRLAGRAKPDRGLRCSPRPSEGRNKRQTF